MAASSLNAVRVRLYFDYPPPSMPDCRMSWLLVDLNKCRVVADLCSVIREKFDYSRKTDFDLFIENCFLPPAESIYVVRDNDSIRVKVSSVSCEHGRKKRHREEEGLFQAPMKKKKHKPSEVNGLTQPTGATKKKHKAKKNKREEQQVESGDALKAAVPAKEPSSSSKSQTNKSSKKASASSVLTNGKVVSSRTHNKSSESSDSSEEVTKKPPPPKSKPAQIVATKRPSLRKTSSSDSSSDDEDEKVPVKKPPKTITSTKTPKEQTSSVTPKSTTNSTTVKRKQAQSSSDSSSSEDDDSRKGSVLVLKKSMTNSKTASLLQTQPPSSSHQGEARKTSASKKPSGDSKMTKTQTSSDSSSSSEDEACKANGPATPKPVKTAQAQTQPCSELCAVVENDATQTPATPVGTMLQENKDKMESSDSSGSSSDTELMIKKPNLQLMAGLAPRGRGRGFPDRVRGRGVVRGGLGRARGTPWKQNFHFHYDDKEESKRSEIQTNKSLVLQMPNAIDKRDEAKNPPEPSPKQDYSTLPLLAAPPAVGQKIVFKLLELTENYTPEVSDYKEGKIIGFNHNTNMIELELLTRSQARTEPGKFDLVYQNPDGSERVEYAVTHGSQLTERWESLLEPRLIVQNPG
ncbi:coilin isoform X2 [Neoarius graeffei]|uniref:coilin isoform X2 n=1 Tax=Neoarius graeffei TaxID=443677 RepID=UPI00298BD7A0|nr:coilin isoform X2 [Neoarius graeffei]